MLTPIVLLVVGALLICRSLSFAYMYAALYVDRNSWCIPRLVKQQKAADLINAMYYFFVALMGMWIFAYGGSLILTKTPTPLFVKHFFPSVLFFLWIMYLAIFHAIDCQMGMMETFNAVVADRAKQEVYTEDNDHEVNLIRGVKRAVKERKYAIGWIVLLVVYIGVQIACK